jgi:hypothetical protein
LGERSRDRRGVNHYLLTRSAYSQAVPIQRNRARLRLTIGVCARSLAAQTNRDVTWLVLVDLEDPLLPQRTAAFISSGLEVIIAPAGDIVRDDVHDLPWGPWKQYIDWTDATLTTRIDDDDAFAPWVLANYREKADAWARRNPKRRLVLTLPTGYRVADGKVNQRTDRVSQFSSLYAPKGDHGTVMDMNHTRVRRLARPMTASTDPGWLWVRHDQTRSARSRASTIERDKMVVASQAVRDLFPVDWSLLG